MDWSILIVIGDGLGVAAAMAKTGAAATIAGLLVGSAGAFGPVAVLAVVYLVGLAMAETLHHTAAVSLVFPIAMAAAAALSASGREGLRALVLPPALRARRWYSSPLSRATETAALLGVTDVTIDAALIEMHWGDWEGQILKPLRRRLGDEMRANEARGLDFCPPGGESPRQVQQRLQPWLQGIAANGEDSAAIAHKGIVRCIYAMACGWDMRGDAPVEFAWDAAHQFELDSNARLSNHYEAIPLTRP